MTDSINSRLGDALQAKPLDPEYVAIVAPMHTTPENKAAATRTLTLRASGSFAAASEAAMAITGSHNRRVASAYLIDNAKGQFPAASEPTRFTYVDRRTKAVYSDWEIIVRLSDAEIAARSKAKAEAEAKENAEREEARPHVEAWKESLQASPFRRVCIDPYEISFEFKDQDSGRVGVERRNSFSKDQFGEAKISGSSWAAKTPQMMARMMRVLAQAQVLADLLNSTPTAEFLFNMQDMSPKASAIRHKIAIDVAVRTLAAAGLLGTAEDEDGFPAGAVVTSVQRKAARGIVS